MGAARDERRGRDHVAGVDSDSATRVGPLGAVEVRGEPGRPAAPLRLAVALLGRRGLEVPVEVVYAEELEGHASGSRGAVDTIRGRGRRLAKRQSGGQCHGQQAAAAARRRETRIEKGRRRVKGAY